MIIAFPRKGEPTRPDPKRMLDELGDLSPAEQNCFICMIEAMKIFRRGGPRQPGGTQMPAPGARRA
jgi:hypothetical protein